MAGRNKSLSYTLHVKALQSTASVLLGKIKTISYTLSSFQP